MTGQTEWHPRPLRRGQKEHDRVIDILTAAFDADPVTLHIDPDRVRRAAAARAAFSLLVDSASPDAVLIDVVGDPIVGVAVWIPPDVAAAEQADGGAASADTGATPDPWATLALPFAGQIERFREAIHALDVAHARAFVGPYWYLRFIATDPDARGRGIATSLMTSRDAAAVAAHVPCGLEAFGDRLRVFYEQRGWEVISTSRVAFTGEPLHAMCRRPWVALGA